MVSPNAADCEAMIGELDNGMGLAGQAVKLLIDAFNGAMRNITGNPLIYLAPDLGLRRLVQELRGYLDQIVQAWQAFVDHHAPIVALIRTAFGWIADVRGPVSEMAGIVRRSESPSMREWTGPASSYYFSEVVPGQALAVSQTHPKAELISKWLMGVAQANVEFLLMYAEKVGDGVAKALATAVSAATIVGVLEAIGKAADIAGDFIKNSVSVFSKSVSYYTGAVGYMRDALSIREDLDAFPDGLWPQAVS